MSSENDRGKHAGHEGSLVLDFEQSYLRCRELIRQPFGVENFRLDATSETAFPPRIFVDPPSEKVLRIPYNRTSHGWIPIAAQMVAKSIRGSGLKPDKDDVIHALGVEAAKAATRLAKVEPQKTFETSTTMFDFALRSLQEMQIGNVFSIEGLTATHASESQLRAFYSRELERQERPKRIMTITDPDFIKPDPKALPLDQFEEAVFIKAEDALDPTDNQAFMKVRSAFRFASMRHGGINHVGPEPIDLHLLQLLTCVLDDPYLTNDALHREELLVVAALHDVVEDEGATLDEITKQFGRKVARYVDALSRVDTNGRKRADGIYYSDLYAQPERVRILKGWDRWLNLTKWKVELDTSALSRLYRGEEEKARKSYVQETDDFVYTLVGNHPLRRMIRQASDELMAA